ncbi:hypothetical protein [Neobacillus sp. LXY-4]|uniref:hypothetical protein n=1 Tax=Neobacillus sp. LXY-4 TaxID=3379826 RepID=UPI003EE0BADE
MQRANICGPSIRKARQVAKMHQIELAAALEVDYNVQISQSDISEIERGVKGVKD